MTSLGDLPRALAVLATVLSLPMFQHVLPDGARRVGTTTPTARPIPPERQPLGELPALPYALDALEPAIDRETMSLHHGRHHQGYVRNLTRALAEHPELAALPLDSLLMRGAALPAAVRRNAGGHFNHSLFWQLMAPAGTGGVPNDALRTALTATFGSEKAFFTRFAEAALGVFGSGWVWLVLTPDGQLAITTTGEQDSPLMSDAIVTGTPLLALDVWEHAYYVRYRNQRDAYVNAWWSVVNWQTVNARFTEAHARIASSAAAPAVRADPRIADLALAQRAQAARSVGADSADVIVMVFADYACPTCQTFHRARGDSLRALAGPSVQLRFAHFPIPRLARGYQAAEAASCAAGLGGAEAFTRMHERLYETADRWSIDRHPGERFVSFAIEFGLDGRTFADCLARDVASIVILTDQRTAAAFGVNGTPTFVVLPRNATSPQQAQVFHGDEPMTRFLEAIARARAAPP